MRWNGVISAPLCPLRRFCARSAVPWVWALSGAILTTRLRGAASVASGGKEDLEHIARLSPAQHAVVVDVYAHALSATFLAGAAIAGCALVLVLFLPEHPLGSRGLSR
jgi:hypothetical protein